ncbi:MAG: ankyrin repeat domain-containing protein [Alphaproteobacteria bacterium]|nr:ankyrin repeat domain-containing protein [Alphaproteobacteria bacterium]
MVESDLQSKPPYPTIGEICRLLAGALDTKSAEPVVSKKLDRLAREGDFDWRLPPQVVEGLISKPLRDFDPDFSDFVGRFISFLLGEHINLLSQVSLDAMSRQEASPLLVRALGARHAAGFLISLRDRFGGPDLGDFLRRDAKPLDVLFQWGETVLGIDVAATAFPDDKQKRDDVGRWRRGETIPDFFGSIRPLQRELEARCSDRKPELLLFGKWLVAARALAWLDRETDKAGFGSLIGMIREEILLNCPPRDVGRELSITNIKAGHRLREVSECGGLLLNVSLTRTKTKGPGDQTAARSELDRFKDLLDWHDADSRARYMLDWCEGRWHILAGSEMKALEFYERASDQALYRAGQNQRQVLEEAIALAAHLGKKSAIKRFKHRALAMGLFSGLFAEFPEKPEVVSDWEIEQLAQAFGMLFPLHGLFPEAAEGGKSKRALPFRVLNLHDADKMKPDLVRPDRVIGIPTLDEAKFRRPQLIWFASEDRVEDVRRLLDAGADVNISDGQGGSALLSALQCAEDGRGRQVLDILLKWPHEKETLDRLTAKKRLSPLYMAVLLGDPKIVTSLIEMGASPDIPASYPPQAPLYLCAERFAFYRKGWAEMNLMQRMAFPGPEDAEIHRRYSGGLSGVAGDQFSMRKLADPRHAEIMRQCIEHFAQKPAKIPREHYLQIVEILLEHGADPNRKQSSPGPGRTPLMVAAENNAADVFRIMVDAGGDPYLQDDQGNDCYVIARSFGSHDVLKLLTE